MVEWSDAFDDQGSDQALENRTNWGNYSDNTAFDVRSSGDYLTTPDIVTRNGQVQGIAPSSDDYWVQCQGENTYNDNKNRWGPSVRVNGQYNQTGSEMYNFRIRGDGSWQLERIQGTTYSIIVSGSDGHSLDTAYWAALQAEGTGATITLSYWLPNATKHDPSVDAPDDTYEDTHADRIQTKHYPGVIGRKLTNEPKIHYIEMDVVAAGSTAYTATGAIQKTGAINRALNMSRNPSGAL